MVHVLYSLFYRRCTVSVCRAISSSGLGSKDSSCMPSVAYMYTPVQVGIWSVCSTFRLILILTPLLLWGMSGLTRVETAEPVSREQVFRYAGSGTMSGRQKSCSKYLPCSADHEQDCGMFYTPGWSILGYKCECIDVFKEDTHRNSPKNILPCE